MKKLFTLIELIVVIVVLGVLAAIVVPNVSSMKEEAKTAAIESNGKNIQTGLDMYKLKTNEYPTIDGKEAQVGSPKQIVFSKLKPEQLRSLPKEGFYWIDYTGEVVYSDTDTPTKVHKQGNDLSWEEPLHGDAVGYRIYGVTGNLTGSAKANQVVFLNEVKDLNYTIVATEQGYDDYLVASVSPNAFVSPGISETTTYAGIDLTETGGNVPADKDVVVEPVKKTPTSFGQYENLENLSSRATDGPRNIFKVEGGIEVLYDSGQSNMRSDIFGLDGKRTLSSSIKGYSGSYSRSISNFDENGDRYVFTKQGLLHILKPDNTSTLISDLTGVLGTNKFYIDKTGIKVESGIAYLAYVDTNRRRHYLAIYDLKNTTLLSKEETGRSFITGLEETNILIKGDYIYTAMNTSFTTSTGDLYIVKWDRKTGKMIKEYTHYERYKEFQPMLMFQDSADNIWYTNAPRYVNKDNLIRIHRLNEETFAGIEETVTLPYDSYFTRIDDSIINDDGSVQLFYHGPSSLRSIKFE